MAPQPDKPTTTGFLCHTCVWGSRSESHELMDIETLVRHGQRYHYLQASQISDYLKAAYCVTRDPKHHGGTQFVPFEKIYERFEEGEGRYGWALGAVRGAEDIEGSRRRASHSRNLSLSEKRSMHKSIIDKLRLEENSIHPKNQFSAPSKGLSFSEGHCWQEPETTNAVIPSPTLEHSPENRRFHTTHNSKSLETPDFRSWDASFSPESLDNVDTPVEDWEKEAVDIFCFDHELASLPYFASQLQEYMDTYGLSEDGLYLGLQHDTGDEVQRWERDRLQVWPEKVMPSAERVGEFVKIGEEEAGNTWPIFDYDYGEAGDYMDMRDIEEYIC